MMLKLIDEPTGSLIREALQSRVAELLVTMAILGMVLHFIADPLQRIPDKMDDLILRLADMQQELIQCNDSR